MEDKCAVAPVNDSGGTGPICAEPTDETWEYDDLRADVNALWARTGVKLRMTGPAICETHMNMVNAEEA